MLDGSWSILIRNGASSAKTGTLLPLAGSSWPLSGVTLLVVSPVNAFAISPGVESSTSPGLTPDALHHETASATRNTSVDETSDSTHAKRASRQHPLASCVDFAYTNRDSFRVSEKYTRFIKLPNEAFTCPPLFGEASLSIIGSSPCVVVGGLESGIIGASAPGIIVESAYGITGASTAGILGLTLSVTTGISAGISSYGITRASTETSLAAPPGVSAAPELGLTLGSTRAGPKTENTVNNRQLKGVQTLTISEE